MTSHMQKRRLRLWRGRRGVTIPELIVAMTIITMGLLALVSTAGFIARSLGESRSDNLAAIAAQSRIELTAGSKCSGLTLNSWTSVTTRGVTEKYMITNNGNNTRKIVDTLKWSTRRGTRKMAYQSILPCRSTD
jgi:prepilin-type N-terminal cleavage/methylation domain-containing protein